MISLPRIYLPGDYLWGSSHETLKKKKKNAKKTKFKKGFPEDYSHLKYIINLMVKCL